MQGRVVGTVAVLVVLGAGAGFGLGAATGSDPASIATPEPVPAVSPAVPTIAPPVIAADPDDPPLAVDLADHQVRLPTGRGYPLTLRVPTGWIRNRPDPLSPVWTWQAPDRTPNTYNMRVEVVRAANQSPGAQVAGRLAALGIATGIHDLDIESQTDVGAAAGFTASYIDDGDFQRLTMQRYVALDDSGQAYATVAVTGRMTDRDGLTSLLDHVAQSLAPGGG